MRLPTLSFAWLIATVGLGVAFSIAAQADCLEVRTPLQEGECRARPDTKTYTHAASSDGTWFYSCEYECRLENGRLATALAHHQSRTTGDMNDLLCQNVSLAIVQKPGAGYKVCERTVTNFELLGVDGAGFRDLITRESYAASTVVRDRNIARLRSEFQVIATSYEESSGGDITSVLFQVASDLREIAFALGERQAGLRPTTDNPSTTPTLVKYVDLLNSETKVTPGSREGFVLIHLALHRTLILNLNR